MEITPQPKNQDIDQQMHQHRKSSINGYTSIKTKNQYLHQSDFGQDHNFDQHIRSKRSKSSDHQINRSKYHNKD